MFSKVLCKVPAKHVVLPKKLLSTSSRLRIVDNPYEVYKFYNKRHDHNEKNVYLAFYILSTGCVISFCYAWYLDWEELTQPWKHRWEFKPYPFLFGSYRSKFPWGEFPIMFNKYRNFTRDGYPTDDEGNLIRELTTYP